MQSTTSSSDKLDLLSSYEDVVRLRIVNLPTDSQIINIKDKIFNRINDYRDSNGKFSVSRNLQLDIIADSLAVNVKNTPEGETCYFNPIITAEEAGYNGNIIGAFSVICSHYSAWAGIRPGFTGTPEDLDEAAFSAYCSIERYYSNVVLNDYTCIGIGIYCVMENEDSAYQKAIKLYVSVVYA